MSTVVKIPKIQSAEISPNPATINKKFTITIKVIEETITLQPEKIYSGEVYSGEV